MCVDAGPEVYYLNKKKDPVSDSRDGEGGAILYRFMAPFDRDCRRNQGDLLSQESIDF